MRRIPLFTRLRLSAIMSAAKKAPAVAMAAVLLVSGGASELQAQYPVAYAASSSASGPVAAQQMFGSSVMTLGDAATTTAPRSRVVDSVFRGAANGTQVQSASYLSDGYSALAAAECNPGYGPDAACNISWYFGGEALAFRREGNRRFGLTQNTFMNNVDYEFGGRFTVGKMMDCTNAWEFVYSGPFRWTRTSDVVGAANINSRFIASPTSLATAFNDANRHTQLLQSDLDSFEVNRRWWAWDAISTLIGIRYIKFEENYQLVSLRSAAPTSAVYRDEIDNNMVGLQVGGDVFFPTSLRTMVSLKGKAGVFANFASRELRMRASDGTTVINGVDDVDISGLVELGMRGHYLFTPSIRLNGGYEVWYMPGVATEARQLPQFLNSGSGSTVRVSDDVVFHGFTFGAEILY